MYGIAATARILAPAALVGLVMLVAVLVTALTPKDAPGVPVAAIFPPWWNAVDVMARVSTTDAAILRNGAIPAVVVVTSQSPDLTERLRAAGALLVLDPLAAAACLGLVSK